MLVEMEQWEPLDIASLSYLLLCNNSVTNLAA